MNPDFIESEKLSAREIEEKNAWLLYVPIVSIKDSAVAHLPCPDGKKGLVVVEGLEQMH
jgi:hypothetical protein